MKLFKRKSKTHSFDEYPSGICVKSEGVYYYVQGKYKRRIFSKRVFESWRFPLVINVTEESLSNLITAKALGFRDGTIVRAMDGTPYLISDRLKRKITNPDFVEAAGVFLNEVPRVSDKELALHELGEDLN